MEIATRREAGYLLATVKGKFSLEAAQSLFQELLDVVALEGVNRVLVDGREVTGKPKTLEQFLYAGFAAAATTQLKKNVIIPTPKFAYVFLESEMDPGKLGETTARKHGMNVRAFDNTEEAAKWLLQPDG